MKTDSGQHTSHRIRDGALLGYGAVRRGKAEEALPFLERTATALQSKEHGALDHAFWLWLAGEYANHAGENAFIYRYASLIEASVGKIERAWEAPDAHWLRVEQYGLFLSNLAVYYGALRSINNMFRSGAPQKVCRAIREKTFSAFMRKTHFISRTGSDEVMDDIVAAAVPFGLVSAGDLAMLDAIGRLQEGKFDTDTAALMAWYYSETGQYARAGQFLAMADERSASQEKSALFVLASEQATRKESVNGRRNGEAEAIRFEHDPVGAECPYMTGLNERYPRLVTVGSAATVRSFMEPYDPYIPVTLEYTVDNGKPHPVPMSAEQSPEGERYLQAELPVFNERVNVRYRFVAESGERRHESCWSMFDVLEWMDVRRAVRVNRTEKQFTVFFEPLSSSGRIPRLDVKETETGTVTAGFSLAENASPYADPGTGLTIDGRYRIGQTEVRIEGSAVTLHLCDDSGTIVSSSCGPDGLSFLQLLADREGTVYKLRMNYAMAGDEKWFGMGERFARMEYSGCEADHYVFNQYKDQGFRTYMPVPFTFGTSGYGLFLQSSLYSVFRFGTVRPDLLQVEADVHRTKQTLDWHLFTGKPLDMIGRFTGLAGKPKLPPKWAFGPWMSSNNWDSEQEVDLQLAQTVRHAIPATVMVIEQWSDESTFYIFNDAGYDVKPGEGRFTYDEFTFPEWGRWPNPKKMVERIHDHGIKALLWQAPVMKFMDGFAHAQRDEDERAMIGNGYAVMNGDGSPYRIPQFEWFRGSLVPDFTNPDAAQWWFEKRRYLLDEIGIDGFKTDGGECIYGSDASFHDGRSGTEMRNEYPNVYVRAFHEFANRHVPGGAITFSRAGYTGAQTMPLHWAGDEKSTFEAFRSTIVAGLSCGMSGIPFWGWDLGGFSGEIPTAELFIRSTQMAAFCPVMQYHAESKGEFNMDRTPWNIAERTGNPEVLALYKKYADVRMNLLPYIYEQAKISSRTGYPLMRAMLLDYPDDPRVCGLALQYMFGESLLVAPVTDEGATEVELYLPEGSWLSLFGNEVLDGGAAVTVAADLPHIPVFLKADNAIALNLGASCELGNDVGNGTAGYERLSLMVFLIERIDYRFTDEQGNGVVLSAVKNGGKVDAEVVVSGDYPVTLIFRALSEATSVSIDGVMAARAEKIGHLGAADYVQRGNEIIVTLKQGKRSVKIGL